MRLTNLVNLERREWFAAGDPSVALKIARSSPVANSPSRLIFDVGLVVLIPLVFATVIELVFTH